jgi:hypothetical protein
MRRESCSAATQYSLDTPGRAFMASHPVNHDDVNKKWIDMNLKFGNERVARHQAFSMPGACMGANAR